MNEESVYCNIELKNGFKIIMARQNNFTQLKKFFSQKIPPVYLTSIGDIINRKASTANSQPQ